jgi:hypothetical protein
LVVDGDLVLGGVGCSDLIADLERIERLGHARLLDRLCIELNAYQFTEL